MTQHICPITWEPIEPHFSYSLRGLRKLNSNLKSLAPLPFTAEEQIEEAKRRADKMSIQGVQPKLSAILNVKDGAFEVVDSGGRYILKPPLQLYPEVPENEDLTMRLAESVEIETPLHGLIYAKDGSRTYFIKRFDRAGKKTKLHVEDFGQLIGLSRETKYDSSMERLISVIERFATFPALEKVKFFRRIVFNFLVGNEDMHVKNYSIIVREGVVMLSPAYDFLSTTIAMGRANEELALPLNGKKKNLSKSLFLKYLAVERLSLPPEIIQDEMKMFFSVSEKWPDMIDRSFLSTQRKTAYKDLVAERFSRLR